jgi:hypothetical protein
MDMRQLAKLTMMITVSLVAVAWLGGAAMAWEPPDPKTYLPSYEKVANAKKVYDDTTALNAVLGPKQVLPKDLYEKLVFPIDEMKKEWSDIVGFKAPDVVGKMAPEIKPGKYTYQDLEKYPGLKQLLPSYLLNMIKPGAPPHAGNMPEFEIVPTQQYYFSLPVAQYTKKNMGKTKLDDKGYLIPSSWEGGVPFPRPSGPNKAQQIMFNVEKRYTGWDGSFAYYGTIVGARKDLSIDYNGALTNRHIKYAGRLALEPYGWLDERAKQRGEYRQFIMNFIAPRDNAGTAMSALYYLDPNKADLLMVYVPQLRRIRMMTSSDSQDPIQGQDMIYDDNDGFLQKLSPTRFPYKYEVLEEREYLVYCYTDGSVTIGKKGLELKNVKLERRPMYVVRLTQLDPNYVYSKRIFYIDKETFLYVHIENYDQKGRLYRTVDYPYGWHPEMGVLSLAGAVSICKDWIDTHSTIMVSHQVPAFWKRKDVGLDGYIQAK